MRQSPSFGHRLLREYLNGGSAGTCDSSRFSIEIDISGKYRKKKKKTSNCLNLEFGYSQELGRRF